MQKEKWIFYTDLFGRQRWERLDAHGCTLAESGGGFESVAAAIEDASRHGFASDRDPRTSLLEWRITAVETSEAHCGSDSER